MKNLLYIGFFLSICGVVQAQQLPQYTQYFLNDFVINPAVAGTKEAWIGQSNNRLQWVGINDAPRTYILSLNGPIRDLNMGVGGYVFNDITGPTRRAGASAAYSYHVKINDDIKLALGLSMGILQFSIDGSQIDLKDNNDVAMSNLNQQVIEPDAGAGFHLYSKDFWFGASAPQLLNNNVQFFEDYDDESARLSRHYFITGGYNFQMIDDLVIQPSLFIKYVDPIPVQFDAALRVIYKDMVWAGASYRMDDAIGVMMGYKYNDNLIIGYSYDITTSALQSYNNGSHEIMLGIKFKRAKDRKNKTEE
jgi:type IX secretion system PorP/SprF family membrane protein